MFILCESCLVLVVQGSSIMSIAGRGTDKSSYTVLILHCQCKHEEKSVFLKPPGLTAKEEALYRT